MACRFDGLKSIPKYKAPDYLVGAIALSQICGLYLPLYVQGSVSMTINLMP